MTHGTKRLAAIGIAAVAVVVGFVAFLRYIPSSLVAKSTWVNGGWQAVTTYNIGDEKYLVTQVSGGFSPSTIQTFHVQSGVTTPGTVHDWPASTGDTYRTDGGLAEAAGSWSDYAIVTGKLFGFIPVSVKSNSAPITVN